MDTAPHKDDCIDLCDSSSGHSDSDEPLSAAKTGGASSKKRSHSGEKDLVRSQNKSARCDSPLSSIHVFIVAGASIGEKRATLLGNIARGLGAHVCTRESELREDSVVVAAKSLCHHKLLKALVSVKLGQLTVVGDEWISACAAEQARVSVNDHVRKDWPQPENRRRNEVQESEDADKSQCSSSSFAAHAAASHTKTTAVTGGGGQKSNVVAAESKDGAGKIAKFVVVLMVKDPDAGAFFEVKERCRLICTPFVQQHCAQFEGVCVCVCKSLRIAHNSHIWEHESTFVH